MAISLMPTLVMQLTDSLRFTNPSNLFFSLATLALAMMNLQLSINLSRVESRIEDLCRDVALNGPSLEADK